MRAFGHRLILRRRACERGQRGGRLLRGHAGAQAPDDAQGGVAVADGAPPALDGGPEIRQRLHSRKFGMGYSNHFEPVAADRHGPAQHRVV